MARSPICYTCRMMSTQCRNCSKYSLGEEIGNAVTHGLGWILSAAGTGVLLTLAAHRGGSARVISVLVFGLSLILLYAASTMYHALPFSRAKKLFKLFDHSAIYLLIAGTYTPLALVNIGGLTGWSLFAGVWSIALAGVLITAFGKGRRWLELTLYLGMGWAVILVLPKLIASINSTGLKLLIAGGLCYTLGVFFYVLKKLPYAHMVWHIFVLGGSVLHFLAIVFGVILKT